MNYIVYLGNKSKYSGKIHKILNGRLDKNFIEPFGGSGAVSLYMSKYIKNVFLNEINENIFRIHYSFKHGTFIELREVIEEIWEFGDPREVKEDYYTARNELNKKYFGFDSIKTGFYNWAISTYAINSMVRFGPNGFNQGWGNRGVGRTEPSKMMTEEKFNSIKKCYHNIELYNEDFVIFVNRFKSGILFMDPPYVEMESGIYNFSKTQYDLFLTIIKNWKDDVIYTDVFSEDRIKELGENWNYQILRDSMGSANVGFNKRTIYESEAAYYNFKIKNSLW
jgi:site-specific DNA-adenine methylase